MADKIFDPNERIKQYLKLAGIDNDVRKCDAYHMSLSQERLKTDEKAMKKLVSQALPQYESTLRRLTRLRDSFDRVLTEFGKEVENEEIAKEITAKDAFKYLQDVIQKIEQYKSELQPAQVQA